MLQHINRKLPANHLFAPNQACVIVVAESVSAHLRTCLHAGKTLPIYFWLLSSQVYSWAHVCLSVVVSAYLCSCMTVAHIRHQGVVIYSNEQGRITRGWGEGQRKCIFCREGGWTPSGGTCLQFFSLFSYPPHLFIFYSSCFYKKDYLQGLDRGDAREVEEKANETGKEKKNGNADWWDTEADVSAFRQKHSVLGRYHHFQDGCCWRRPLWDQPGDRLLSLPLPLSGWHTNSTFFLQVCSSSAMRRIQTPQ